MIAEQIEIFYVHQVESIKWNNIARINEPENDWHQVLVLLQ